MTCLHGSLVVPAGAMRCTSVDGYKLKPGDNVNDLRSDIRHADIVIGLVTPAGLRSGWVLMELGAAWGAEKKTCPVLAGSVSFENIPGPLQTTHGVLLTSAPDVAALMDVVADAAHWPKRPGGQAHKAVADLVTAAGAVDTEGGARKVPHAGPPAQPVVADERDAAIRLQGWIQNNRETMGRGVSLAGLDRELGLASGLASKLMPAAADAEGWDEKKRGSDLVLYEERLMVLGGSFGGELD